MPASIVSLDRYWIRRKFFKVFGASFHIFDAEGNVVGFSKQAAFRLKEDIRVFADEEAQVPLLTIQARQIVDFSAAYDVVDPTEKRKVGAARRKGWTSLFRDAWELLDEQDRPVAQVKEDSGGLAFLRRFLTNLIPQSFVVRGKDDREIATFSQRFNPFVYKMDVTVASPAIDRRLILAGAVLIAAVEGRQG